VSNFPKLPFPAQAWLGNHNKEAEAASKEEEVVDLVVEVEGGPEEALPELPPTQQQQQK